jgi:hypothetical protein
VKKRHTIERQWLNMNNLIYSARMALRDLLEVSVFTKGTDRVYLSVTSDLTWEGGAPEADAQREEREQARRVHTEKAVLTAVDRLGDMDMIIAGGENAVSGLIESGSAEILRKAA